MHNRTHSSASCTRGKKEKKNFFFFDFDFTPAGTGRCAILTLNDSATSCAMIVTRSYLLAIISMPAPRSGEEKNSPPNLRTANRSQPARQIYAHAPGNDTISIGVMAAQKPMAIKMRVKKTHRNISAFFFRMRLSCLGIGRSARCKVRNLLDERIAYRLPS